MAIKLTEWRLKLNDQVGSVLNRLNSAADKTSGKIDGIQNRLNSGKFQAFTSEIPQAGRAMELFSSRYALAGAGIAATGALMYKGSELALDYEKSMAKINATAQLTPEALGRLKAELIGIGENSGGNFMRIPDAFEKINSTINNVNRSLEITKIASKGAQAGFVDIDLAAEALSKTLSIVGSRDNATGIMDMMLKAKAVGAGEFSDFATYLPQLIASGDNLNIGHKDIAGLFSFMTTKGSASDSAMLLQNAFTAMGKSDIQKGFAKQGIHLFDKEGNMRDLGQFFTEVNLRLSRMNSEAKSNWLESVGLKDAQAKSAFSVLAGDATKLKEIMEEVRNSTGELNKQLDYTENKTRSWSEIGDKIKSGMLGMADYLLPVVDKMIYGAENIARVMRGRNKVEADGYWQLEKSKIDEKLARDFAKSMVLKYVDKTMGPAAFEGNQEKMPKNVKERYDYFYKMDLAKLTGTAYGGDYDKFLKEEKDRLSKEREKKPTPPPPNPNLGAGKNVQDGINTISQGGQRIINIQFGKLNENIVIQPQTLKEGTTEVALNLEEMLVRAISGAEESLANE